MAHFIFLDRDGTIIRDKGYPHRIEDYELLPGAAEGLARLAALGYRLAIVTNQSGIGRGLFDEAAYERFEAYLHDDLEAKGVEIAASLHCPHTPDADCECRKPKIGLFKRAVKELGANLSESWMIGDKPSDLEAGRNAGCRGSVFIRSEKYAAEGCLSAGDLVEAATVIERALKEDS